MCGLWISPLESPQNSYTCRIYAYSGSVDRFWILSLFPRDQCTGSCLRSWALKLVLYHYIINSWMHALKYEYALGWWPMAWRRRCLWRLLEHLRQKAYTVGHRVREISIQRGKYPQVPRGGGADVQCFWSRGESRTFWIFPIHQKTLTHCRMKESEMRADWFTLRYCV